VHVETVGFLTDKALGTYSNREAICVYEFMCIFLNIGTLRTNKCGKYHGHISNKIGGEDIYHCHFEGYDCVRIFMLKTHKKHIHIFFVSKIFHTYQCQ
jgi:hypothetical protein